MYSQAALTQCGRKSCSITLYTFLFGVMCCSVLEHGKNKISPNRIVDSSLHLQFGITESRETLFGSLSFPREGRLKRVEGKLRTWQHCTTLEDWRVPKDRVQRFLARNQEIPLILAGGAQGEYVPTVP